MTELGVFVVWSRAATLLPRILEHLEARFEIHRAVEIEWSPDLIGENYHRFYRGKATPPYGGVFEAQKGRGPFTVITVLDHEPHYAERMTNAGVAVVNTRWFDTKQLLRSWVNDRMEIHSADSSSEARRDLLLLLGVTSDDFMQLHVEPWDRTIERVHRDISGADGWLSFDELFAALNASVRYVVLRNFEALPADHRVGPHTGVDILTDDLLESIRILNARPERGLVTDFGGRFWVDVGDEPVRFAIWPVEAGYLDPAWAASVLDRRVDHNGLYVPSAVDYFETLAYHAVYQKRKWQQEYGRRLSAMAVELGISAWDDGRLDLEQARASVEVMMRRYGYEVTVPRDTSAFFNYHVAGRSMPLVRQKLRGVQRVGFEMLSAVAAPALQRVRAWRSQLVRRYPSLRQLARGRRARA